MAGQGGWNFANKARGGSASGYSYFNKPHAQSGGSMDQGWQDERRSYQYQGYQGQQWPSSAGYEDYGYDETYEDQTGWQNFQGGINFGNGSVGHSGYQQGGGINYGDRKRPWERDGRPALLGRAPKRRQQEPNYYGGFAPAGSDYGGYGSTSTAADWRQVPSSSGWGMGAGDYYEENEHLQDVEYGGFMGGSKQGRRNRDSKRTTWKSRRETGDHVDRWQKRQDSPDDKTIYNKHRTLNQMDEKKGFLQAIRDVMSAMKCASETLSVEAKAESEVAEYKQQAGETKEETDQADKENDTTEEVKESEEKNKTENTDAKTEKEDINTEDGKDNTIVGLEPEKMEKEIAAKQSSKASPQVLTGVIRVGPARRKLMVKDATDHGEELVAVFKEKPRKQMLHRLASLIEFNLKGPLCDKAVISPDETTEMITVNLEKYDCKYPILISFTSPAYSDDAEPNTNTDTQNDGELLSEDKCRLALSKIRRLRWRKKSKEEFELPIVRIFMDFARRLPGWSCMSSYAAEVLVHSVMDKIAKDVRESEYSISRLFIQCVEVLAAGLALAGGPGLKDPCEAGCIDIFGNLKPQEAEDLTEAAQLALRMHACGQLEKLMDV